MDDKLANFDAKFGGAVVNALQVYAKYMREAADEALKGAAQPKQGDPANLRDWSREDLLMAVRAGGMLWDSNNGADMLEVLSERQIELLELASHAYLTAPEQAAEDATKTISVRPTERGFAGMAAIFTQQADRADAAATAYGELTAEPEDEFHDENEEYERARRTSSDEDDDPDGTYTEDSHGNWHRVENPPRYGGQS